MSVDLSAPLYAHYQRSLKRADEARRRGDLPQAAAATRQCAMLMRQYARLASDPALRQKRLERALAHESAIDATGRLRVLPPVSEDQQGSGDESFADQIEQLIHRSTVTWEDIGGLEPTKREIKTAYGLALAQPPDGIRVTGWRNVLFFGPPGTGKTLLAAATSQGLEATFFSVKVSDLLSKFFGESSKLIRALYAEARRRSPSVIFLDEFESLTPSRGASDSGAERRIVSALLPELDGLATKDTSDYVLTIAATNLPWLVDKAVLSRFERKIYIPLPDEPARSAILRMQLESRGYTTTSSQADLVRQTAGLSGREIERACKAAISRMLERANPDLIGRVDLGRAAVKGYRLRIEPLTKSDFEWALSLRPPETSDHDLERFETWRRLAES